MQRLSPSHVILAIVFLSSVCIPMHGQATSQTAAPEKQVPTPVRLKPYFSDSVDPARPHSVEFRTIDQMTAKDRQLAANAEGSIGEDVKFSGLEFNQGAWSYEQVVCPALPNHIFLRFLRNNGTGDVSMFTASIPRGEEGRVRIIPIQLRGYSLFSPAPINALTISAFNHIRAEENPDSDPNSAPDWLGTALCYEALAGGHPQAATVSENPAAEKFPVASEALLSVGNNGGAELSFTDMSTQPRPTRWSMTFDRKGRLIKGGHAPAAMMNIKLEHPLAVNKVGPPQQMTAPKVKTYHPPAPAVVTRNPPAPPQTVTAAPAANPPS